MESWNQQKLDKYQRGANYQLNQKHLCNITTMLPPRYREKQREETQRDKEKQGQREAERNRER